MEFLIPFYHQRWGVVKDYFKKYPFLTTFSFQSTQCGGLLRAHLSRRRQVVVVRRANLVASKGSWKKVICPPKLVLQPCMELGASFLFLPGVSGDKSFPLFLADELL